MSSDPTLNGKAQLRSKLTAARANRAAGLTAADRAAAATEVARAVLAEPLITVSLDPRRPVASYLPLDSEPDTTELYEQLVRQGIRVLVPECVTDPAGDPTMAWIELDAANTGDVTNPGASRTEPRRDQRGMPIPEGRQVGVGAQGLADLDCGLILVPALAATNNGQRLGKGAGYYDRLLGELSQYFEHDRYPVSVAIVFAHELLDAVPTEPHDAAVSAVVAI